MVIDTPSPQVEVLRGLGLFAGLDDGALRRIGATLDDIEVDAGEVLTIEGEPGEDSFVIVSGTAEVSVAGHGIATLGPGALFGEMAALDGGSRSATIRAATSMRLLAAGPDGLETLLEHPAVAVRVLHGVVARLRDTNAAAAATARARRTAPGARVLGRATPADLPTHYTLELSEDERQRFRVMAAHAVATEAQAWARAGIGPGARVADVGCGPGAITVELARIVGEGGEVVAVDRSPEALAAAAEEADAAGLTNVRFASGEAAATGLEPGAFDAVMMRHVLVHNGPRIRDIVGHLAGLLRPGGCVYMLEFSALGWAFVPDDAALAEERERWLQLLDLQRNDLAMGTKLAAVVRDAGLELVEFTGRNEVFWVSELEHPGGPAYAARDAIVAAGLASEDDCRRWNAAHERIRSDREGKYMCAPLYAAIGRRRA
jgi:CRP-like cAMP-binding protein